MKNQLLLSVLILLVTLPLFAFKAIDGAQLEKVPKVALVVKSAPASGSLEINKETADVNTEQSVIKHDDPDAQNTEAPEDNTELSAIKHDGPDTQNTEVPQHNTELSEEAEDNNMEDSMAGHNNASAFYEIGVSENSTGRHQEAIAAFKQAINIKPGYVEAHYNLGLSYLMLDDKVSALEQYKILKTLDPKEADRLHLKALAIASLHTENKYILQVGAYKNIDNANKMLGNLQSDYLLTNIEQINNLNKVRIHGIRTLNEPTAPYQI
jgi:tetratricopeptide (TPR) repeat protein